MSTEIRLDRKGPVACLLLDGPASLNSLDLAAVKSLLTNLRTLSRDESVRALVITGSGRGFCAGWQLDAETVPGLVGETLGERQAHLMDLYFNPIVETLADLPFPSIAAVNGVCAGAGVSLALAADITLAAQSASFVLTFAPRLGLIPDLGLTWKLPRLIGWSRAQALAMLGERLSAPLAEEWGMVWRCLPDADLERESMSIATRLAQGPAGICGEVRRAYRAAQDNDLPAQLEYERRRQRDLLDRPAFAEGARAFAEKRAPRFPDNGE